MSYLRFFSCIENDELSSESLGVLPGAIIFPYFESSNITVDGFTSNHIEFDFSSV